MSDTPTPGAEEPALQGVGAYFLSVVEASQDCLRVLSVDGRVEYMNEQGQALLEIDDFGVRNRNRHWPSLWPEESRALVEEALDEARSGRIASFRAFCPTVKGSPRWWDTVISPIFDDNRQIVRFLATSRDISAERQAESQRELLVNELNHRVKNTLAIVQSIAAQSLRNAGVDRLARDAFEGRLMAISATHNVLTDANWEAASLRQILEGAVVPYCTQPTQLEISGDDMRVAPKPAVSLALAFHELAINALKYGALSAPEGNVAVHCGVDRAKGRLGIRWTESGGPSVSPPARRGFGSRILELALPNDLQGQVKVDFRAEGLNCSVDAPLSAVDF
jgi:PAS domain S-box-containing protein